MPLHCCPGLGRSVTCRIPHVYVMTPQRPPICAARGMESAGDEWNTTDYQLLCPPGALVTGIAVLHGPFVYRVGPLKCTDGTVTGMSSNMFTTGTPATYTPSSYITGFPVVYTGTFIGGMAVRPRMGPDVSFGSEGDWADRVVHPPAMCPADSFLAGVYGTTGPNGLVSIGPICRAARELTLIQHWLLGCEYENT